MPVDLLPKRDHQLALIRLRTVCDELRVHVEETTPVATRLLQLLRSYPPEVLYRYESTLEKLQNVSASLTEQLEFLGARHPGSKLFRGEHVFSPVTFANFLMKEHGGTGNEENVIESATILLKGRLSEHEARTRQLKSDREALLRVAESVRDHLSRSYRLELLPRNNQETSDLLACIWFAFDVGLLSKLKRQQSASRAKELLSTEHIAAVFGRLLNAYRQQLSTQLSNKLKETKRRLLEEAAHNWIEKLMHSADKPTPLDTTQRVMTAICGLHFAYACHQSLDFGRMSPEAQQKYSDLIDSVPADTVRVAVTQLLEQDILDDEAFKLLRYVRSVRDAYVAARDTSPSTG